MDDFKKMIKAGSIYTAMSNYYYLLTKEELKNVCLEIEFARYEQLSDKTLISNILDSLND